MPREYRFDYRKSQPNGFASLMRETGMNIDIDKLSEEELIDLNHRIVERLRFLNQNAGTFRDAGLQNRRACHLPAGRSAASRWNGHPLQQKDGNGDHR